MDVWEALDCYSYGKQGGDGDVNGEVPSILAAQDYLLYSTWYNLEGMPRK